MEVEETLDDGWSRRFVDPVSGTGWLATYLQTERHGGGYQILMRLPRPERADWLELVAHSSHPAEIWVAAMALGEDPESYGALLDVLMEAARGAEWQRLGIAAAWSGITSPMYRRPIQDKESAEITTDAAEFERIAAAASNLLARAGKATGISFGEKKGWPDAEHA
jgi:hypothetical protein